jgi:hypothetical protein
LTTQHHNLCGAHYVLADPEVPVTATGRHQGALVLTPATALFGWAAWSDTLDCSESATAGLSFSAP